MITRLAQTVLRILLLLALSGVSATRATSAPQQVVTGVYMHNVNDIDMKSSTYTADFYLWFRWRGDLDPTETFEFTNTVEHWGLTQEPTYPEAILLPSGEMYQVYHVQGKFNRKFELWNYPLDTQEVTVEYEDTRNTGEALQYVADTKDCGYNSRLRLPGWEIKRSISDTDLSAYTSHFGDLRSKHVPEIYPRMKFALVIHRSRRAYMMRLLLPITVILLSTFTSFFLLPDYADARIGIAVTGLLSTVALHLAEGSDLPSVGYLVLMDKVYNLSYLLILICLIETITVVRWNDDGMKERARKWDGRLAWALPLTYVLGLLGLIFIR